MIKLTDSELDQVFRAAAPIPAHDRDRFLKDVAERLAGVTIGPGSVYKACHEVQRELLRGNYPDFTNGGGGGSWSKYRSR
jgi:hypothetical protein